MGISSFLKNNNLIRSQLTIYKTKTVVISLDLISTCDQTMAPAKNARVCIISFSAFKPNFVTNSPDLCKKKLSAKILA